MDALSISPMIMTRKSIERTKSLGRGVARRNHRRLMIKGLSGCQGLDLKTCLKSAQKIWCMDFPGYSIGGLAVGESHEEMNAVLDFTALLQKTSHAYLLR